MSFEMTLIGNRALQEKARVKSLLECNYFSESYGLALSEQEAYELIAARNLSLKTTARFEFGGAVLQKLIAAFCSSSYVDTKTYAQTLSDLVEVFYTYKGEFSDLLSDDELIDLMAQAFEKYSGGSVEKLSGDLLFDMARNVRAGHDPFYEEEITLDEDELYEQEKRAEQNG